MTIDRLPLDPAILDELAAMAQPHAHALLEDIRARFGDEASGTMFTVAMFMLGGWALKRIGRADRAPNAVAKLWSLQGVPFSLEPKQVQ